MTALQRLLDTTSKVIFEIFADEPVYTDSHLRFSHLVDEDDNSYLLAENTRDSEKIRKPSRNPLAIVSVTFERNFPIVFLLWFGQNYAMRNPIYFCLWRSKMLA